MTYGPPKVLPVLTALGLIALLFVGVRSSHADARWGASSAAAELGMSQKQLQRSTGLGRIQLWSFVRRAQTVGGLSRRQLLIVLRHPQLIPAIPIYSESRRSGLSVISSRYPSKGCRPTGAFVRKRNLTKNTLWEFSVKKRWCWNKARKRVWVVPGSIEVKHPIPNASNIAGWRYDGLTDKADFYYNYRGSGRRGAHSTFRNGKFSFCPPRILCIRTRQAIVRLGVRWTGSAFENHADQ